MHEGCGGRLCRACRPVMSRMRLTRPMLTADGEPTGEIAHTGWVCGFICPAETSHRRLDLPGRTGGGLVRMVVAAGSLSPLAAGDMITCGGASYTVTGAAAPDGSVLLREQC